MTALAPGSTIGILGSGQLGRMLAMSAAQLGYRVHIYAPESGPACDVSAAFTRGGYGDRETLALFAKTVDVVTYEFENVHSEGVAHLAGLKPVRPGPLALDVSRYRPNEKSFVRQLGGTTAAFRTVESLAELKDAVAEIGAPSILKTSMFGYDGKGQARLASPADADAAWEAVAGQPSVLEGFVSFTHEFSIVLARGVDGSIQSYPPPWNEHEDGILARSTIPAPPEIAGQWTVAAALAGRVAEALDYVGVLTLEFFATEHGPVFNEMAPRVHNSGHWTIEGAETSQFENHIRAICGLPLGATSLTGIEVMMENLIGTDADRWAELLAEPGAHLHLYGKNDARPGRKMGHVTRVTR